ncbi:MAG TPA: hypothetical protein VMC80_01680 [Patescibacteria group bacterium]|nr:hypothetical protein [Patescibacteria group bacterium]
MDLEKRIARKIKHLNDREQKLHAEAQGLFPIILNNFNSDIEVVQVMFKPGYGVVPATEINYENGIFTITSGMYKTPSGPTKDCMKVPSEMIGILISSFRDYERRHSNVFVRAGFDVGK